LPRQRLKEETMLTAADVMTREVVSVGPDTPVRAIAELLFTRRISGVPVLEDGRLIGVVSEGDLIGHAAATGEQRRSWWLSALMNDSASARDYAKTHGRTARDVMTSAVITIGEAATLAEIAKTLERHRIKRVPVLREGKLVGIVSRGNLLQALATLEVEAAGTVDDDTIRERLIAELRGQSWAHLPPDAIVVENGIVRLSGIVQTEDERRALRIAAENTPGVKGVDDHLTIWSPAPI
jgi:CBS domain-containing protein